jgi:hypothetical protein
MYDMVQILCLSKSDLLWVQQQLGTCFQPLWLLATLTWRPVRGVAAAQVEGKYIVY